VLRAQFVFTFGSGFPAGAGSRSRREANAELNSERHARTPNPEPRTPNLEPRTSNFELRTEREHEPSTQNPEV
jgi:hypothetical protein